jgi:hypothetical protein
MRIVDVESVPVVSDPKVSVPVESEPVEKEPEANDPEKNSHERQVREMNGLEGKRPVANAPGRKVRLEKTFGASVQEESVPAVNGLRRQNRVIPHGVKLYQLKSGYRLLPPHASTTTMMISFKSMIIPEMAKNRLQLGTKRFRRLSKKISTLMGNPKENHEGANPTIAVADRWRPGQIIR